MTFQVWSQNNSKKRLLDTSCLPSICLSACTTPSHAIGTVVKFRTYIFYEFFKQISILAKTEQRLAHTFHADLPKRVRACQHQSAYQRHSLFSEIHEETKEIVLVISTQLRVRRGKTVERAGNCAYNMIDFMYGVSTFEGYGL